MSHSHMAGHYTIASCLSGATNLLVATAPCLLSSRPTDLPIHHTHITGIWKAGWHCTTSSRSHHPSPEAIHLNVLPCHASARVDTWWVVTLAALAAIVAAPLLLWRRPSAEEVVQGGITVIRILCHRMHLTSSCLD
eukprot:Skav202073  [mRNA]  locus=scaffold1138:768014:768620:+ [translate_table: standard]